MALIDKNVLDYIEDVDSKLPAPGGGSVASLVGALGVALAKMSAHLSIEKKKFAEASKEKQDKYLLAFKELDYYKNRLIEGIDNDAISYQGVIDAYKSKDDEQIQGALKSAAFVAYEIESSAYEALKYLDKLIELGNKYLYSDLISGAILLASCVEMASLNVVANANSINEETYKNKYLEDSARLVKNAKSLKNKTIKKINDLK